MIKIKNYFLFLLDKVLTSIAFFPVVFSFGGFLLSFLALLLEEWGITVYLLDVAPPLVINNADTARTLLSTFIGGLITLMVFSFTMVMVLLNQASTNFSPRLLPGLISDKRHQIVLGCYLGTILFSILVLISVLPNGDAYQLPGFSVLLSILMGIACLGLFVYFIHSISEEIQVTKILQRIYRDTQRHLVSLRDDERSNGKISFPDTESWYVLASAKSGYFKDISSVSLKELAEKYDTVFHIIPIRGLFVLEGIPIIRSEKELSEEEEKEVLSCLNFSTTTLIRENYLLGFKQITEIAVKAMSPGINDPGTAINAVDYLTKLFATRMHLFDDPEYYLDDDESLLIFINTVDFSVLIYNNLASLRQYCKHDVILMEKLLLMLKYLLVQKKGQKAYKKIVLNEIDVLLADAENAIENELDLKKIRTLAEELNPVGIDKNDGSTTL